MTPLAVPAPRDQSDPDLVARSDAVQLFVARARAAGATTEIEPRTAPLLGTLCRRLDGLPLALELAATRVPALGLSEVVARLGDRFRLLGSGRRGGPERQRTLEAMLDWSWDLLDGDERRVLRRLAVHADGCTLAAAAAVCHGEPDERADGPDRSDPDEGESATADVLGRLVERSLVVADHAPDGTRYRLLESVGAYAGDRLVESGESDAVRRRHLDWYVVVAEQADAHLRGSDQAVWLAALDAESANMQVALDTAADLGLPDLAHRLVAALGWYWMLRGRTAVAVRAFDRALSLAPEVSDRGPRPGGVPPAGRRGHPRGDHRSRRSVGRRARRLRGARRRGGAGPVGHGARHGRHRRRPGGRRRVAAGRGGGGGRRPRRPLGGGRRPARGGRARAHARRSRPPPPPGVPQRSAVRRGRRRLGAPGRGGVAGGARRARGRPRHGREGAGLGPGRGRAAGPVASAWPAGWACSGGSPTSARTGPRRGTWPSRPCAWPSSRPTGRSRSWRSWCWASPPASPASWRTPRRICGPSSTGRASTPTRSCQGRPRSGPFPRTW